MPRAPAVGGCSDRWRHRDPPADPQHPLRVLVTGDSLSTYVAEQMDQLGHGAGLVRIKGVWADGTGLSNPSFYNWQKAA